MKDIETQGSNLFSRNIVELKLISDRIAEGKGEKAGIFSNTYQILYILDRKEKVIKEIIGYCVGFKGQIDLYYARDLQDWGTDTYEVVWGFVQDMAGL